MALSSKTASMALSGAGDGGANQVAVLLRYLIRSTIILERAVTIRM
jgi:hypothetical protein